MRLVSFLNLKQIGVTEDDCSGLPFIVAYFLFMYFIIINIHEICLSLSLFHCLYISQYFIFMKYIWIFINIHVFISLVTKIHNIHNKGSWKSVNHKSVSLQNAYYFLRLWWKWNIFLGATLGKESLITWQKERQKHSCWYVQRKQLESPRKGMAFNLFCSTIEDI